MPHYRKLYVKTTESLDVNDMPDDFTRLMWVLLPLGLCREGRGIDSPAWIKSKIFPLREDVNSQQITVSMDWFAKHGMIIRYTVDSRGYFYLPSWERYQGDTSREAPSNYPPPPKSNQDEVKSRSRVDQDKDKKRVLVDEYDSESISDSLTESLNENPAKNDFSNLSATFVNETKIPELTGGPRKWFETLKKLGEAGVEPIDIINAIHILRDKNYSIVGLHSIANTAISEMSKRKGRKKQDRTSEESQKRYTEWEATS